MLDTSDSATDFEWTGVRLRAAMLVADGALTEEKIAAEVAVSRSSITRWRKRSEFKARVDELRAEIEEQTRNYGIALRFRRILALQDLYDRLKRVIDERAAAPEFDGIPGGKTGLLTRKAKICAAGRPGANSVVIWEHAVDNKLVHEMLSLLKLAADEMSEWKELRQDEPANPKQEIDLSRLTDEELRLYGDLVAKVRPGGKAPGGPGLSSSQADGAQCASRNGLQACCQR